MKRLFKQLNLADKTVLYSVIISVIILLAGFGVDIARAAWEEPQAQPPAGNIYAPLNSGPAKQAKQGRLLLDPSYDPNSTSVPQIDYQLEVRGLDPLIPDDGLHNTFVTYLDVVGGLTVDATTLTVLPGSNPGQGKVGIGTDTPGTDAPEVKIEIVGGTAQVGTGDTPIIGTAITSATSAAEQYGVYAEKTTATDVVTGVSTSGAGISGSNTANGQGIYGISETRSGVSGSSDATYDAGIARAAVYGAAAPTGWAGYFQQRLFGSDQVIGRKFSPNRLQLSQIPYTAGWQARTISDSLVKNVHLIAFDGKSVWAARVSYDYGRLYVINPVTINIEYEFSENFVTELGGNMAAHSFSKLIYGGGYIWMAYGVRRGNGEFTASVAKINPTTYELSNYETETVHGGADAYTYYSRTVDMYYDDVTTPGTPYLWTINEIGVHVSTTNSEMFEYSITRINANDGSGRITFKIDPTAINGNKCLNFDEQLCSDHLDNDDSADGIDNGLCVYSLPEATCRTSGGTWSPSYCESSGYHSGSSCVSAGFNWVEADGVCSDRTYTDETNCETNGAKWAIGTCSDPTRDQAQCSSCTPGGTWDSDTGTCVGSAGCTTQAMCESPLNSGNWVGADADCSQSSLGTFPNTERLFVDEIGIPSGITMDNSGYIWISFSGVSQGGRGATRQYKGPAYAKILASDPDVAVNQSVFCSGPGSDPGDITHGSDLDNIWVSYATSEYRPAWLQDSAHGLARVTRATGSIDSGNFYSTVPASPEIQYYGDTPGGPSLWAIVRNRFQKYNTAYPAPAQPLELQNSYETSGEPFEFAFDQRDLNLPYVWTADGSTGSITRYTVAAPYNHNTFIILGAYTSAVAFDGTNIWTANTYTDTVSKYRAPDGKKVGDYLVARGPQQIMYDGYNIWVASSGNALTKLSAGTGDQLGNYTVTGGTTGAENVFDGKNLWVAQTDSNRLKRIDLTSCSDTTHTCPSTNISNQNGPTQLAFDGQYVWFSHSSTSQISRIKPDGTELANFSISGQTINGNIQDMVYDGTYLWFGTKFTDSQGNSLFKVDVQNCVIGGNCPMVGTYPIYHDAGRCDASPYQYCSSNEDCQSGVLCNNNNERDEMYSGVGKIVFDGINIWVANMTATDYLQPRECNDGVDNDNDGLTDSTDPDCWNGGNFNPADLHEANSNTYFGTTQPECSDNLDNDGNGMCDFDGASGNPGCSGKKDPGCSDPNDTGESTYFNESHITRIVAATGAIVESQPFGGYCRATDLAFDGTYIWMSTGGGCNSEVLRQYYSGSGSGGIDLSGLVSLQGLRPESLLSASNSPGTPQPGSFYISGNATLGAGLTVVGDLVVQNNAWGSGGVNKNFGTSCDSGEFATEVTPTGIICKKL